MALKMIAPPGVTHLHIDAIVYRAAADGFFYVEARHLDAFRRSGFRLDAVEVDPDELIAAVSTRGASRIQHGGAIYQATSNGIFLIPRRLLQELHHFGIVPKPS